MTKTEKCHFFLGSGCAVGGTTSLTSSHAQLSSSLLINQHYPRFAIGIVSKTTPPPLSGLERQTALHWILMHVPQLLFPLRCAPHDQILEAGLPQVFNPFLPKLCLTAIPPASLGPAPAAPSLA